LDEIVMEMASAHAEEKDGDYRQDGLLICGNCGEPKECKTELMGRIVTVPCLCRCAEAEYERKQAEWKEKQRRLAISRMRVEGIQDDSLRDVHFDENDTSRNTRVCRRFVEKWNDIFKENTGLLMSGPVGTGKTFCAACIANALIDKGVPVLMTSFPSVLKVDSFEVNDMIRQAQEYDLIVLDDVGVERESDYALEVAFQFIDARYRTGKPLIVTTNLTVQEMASVQNIKLKRIYDRILEMCVLLAFEGKNRRNDERSRKYGTIKEILADD